MARNSPKNSGRLPRETPIEKINSDVQSVCSIELYFCKDGGNHRIPMRTPAAMIKRVSMCCVTPTKIYTTAQRPDRFAHCARAFATSIS